jgi:hypothetical protein
MVDQLRPGPTGDFPDGQLNDEDEGGLMMACTVVDGRVKIDFGKPIAWFALDADSALAFAYMITGSALRAKRETDKS